MLYKVTGDIEYIRFCHCGYCEGHRTIKPVSDMIEADSPELAIEKAIDEAIINSNYDDAQWCKEPLVTEASQDQLMIAIGAPRLPGF